MIQPLDPTRHYETGELVKFFNKLVEEYNWHTHATGTFMDKKEIQTTWPKYNPPPNQE